MMNNIALAVTLALSPAIAAVGQPATAWAGTDAGTDGYLVVRPEHPDPNEIVETYNDTSGFATTRLQHEPMIVDWPMEFPMGQPMTPQERIDEWLHPSLDSWNRAAGWEMFVMRTEETPVEDIDVFFHIDAETVCPDAGACVTWQFSQGGWSAGGWYIGCDLHFWPWYPPQDFVAHELGHCLGFMDIPDPESDGYYGIMSYGRQWGANPENEQDVNSLIAAGYAA